MWSELDPNLTKLRFPEDCHHTATGVYGSWYTPSAITELTVRCPKLTEVNLSLIEYDKFRQLESSDSTLTALAKGCPNLTTINLSFCYRITDTSIMALAKSCPNLTEVNLCYCNQVTETGIMALATHCPNLTHLELTNHARPGSISHKVIQLCLPNLKELIVDGLPWFPSQDNLSRLDVLGKPELLADLRYCYCKTGLVSVGNLLVAVYRPHFATLRLKRFWREVCYNPAYRYARERILRMAESE